VYGRPMVFIESAVFTRQVQALSDDEYADLQWHLAHGHPRHGRPAQGALGRWW
jgi:hypothetical protein